MKKLCEIKMYRSIVNRLKEIVSEFTNVNKNKLSLSSNIIRDFGIDKEDIQKIRKKIENEFDIILPKNIFQEFNTIGEIVGFIESEIGR